MCYETALPFRFRGGVKGIIHTPTKDFLKKVLGKDEKFYERLDAVKWVWSAVSSGPGS